MTEPALTETVPPGIHLLIDFWEARNLSDVAGVDQAMRAAAAACGATVLNVMLHAFGDGEGAGVTGVAILAESHISIHTWPELGYVALDVFMCGACDPHLALPVLRAYFKPGREAVQAIRRGR